MLTAGSKVITRHHTAHRRGYVAQSRTRPRTHGEARRTRAGVAGAELTHPPTPRPRPRSRPVLVGRTALVRERDAQGEEGGRR